MVTPSISFAPSHLWNLWVLSLFFPPDSLSINNVSIDSMIKVHTDSWSLSSLSPLLRSQTTIMSPLDCWNSLQTDGPNSAFVYQALSHIYIRYNLFYTWKPEWSSEIKVIFWQFSAQNPSVPCHLTQRKKIQRLYKPLQGPTRFVPSLRLLPWYLCCSHTSFLVVPCTQSMLLLQGVHNCWSLPGILFPRILLSHSFSSFMSLPKCRFSTNAFPNHRI